MSFAAQYQYVLHERHQHVASLIEAGALDVGLIIFSLLALGLARAGLSAKIERAAVIGCAIGSAVMNYAAADVTSPRSVLAYCMPPVFLAFVVDRVVRHDPAPRPGHERGPVPVVGPGGCRHARPAGPGPGRAVRPAVPGGGAEHVLRACAGPSWRPRRCPRRPR